MASRFAHRKIQLQFIGIFETKNKTRSRLKIEKNLSLEYKTICE